MTSPPDAASPSPTATPSPTGVLHFGPFVLDVAGARLIRGASPVALRPKAFDLLVVLASRPGELVSKDALLDLVWGRRFITEGVIKSIVAELRQALGEDPKAPRWITTVPRRGYRFDAAVSAGPAGAATTAPAEVWSPGVAPAADVAAAPGNLPAAQGELIGRGQALATVCDLLQRHRLLTLAGPAGVGKTRLSLALAALQQQAGQRDGAWFIELAALPAGPQAGNALCAALAQAMRLDSSAGTDEQALARSLRPLQALVVLDNAEHLVQPLAPLVQRLLATAPALRIVLTSQEPLRLADEQVYRLQALALTPLVGDDPELTDALQPGRASERDDRSLQEPGSAVRLFTARATARQQDFSLQPGQHRTVAAICHALDGMPLAIELAAARVPLLGVDGIAALLLRGGRGADSHFQVLSHGDRTAPARQQSLHDALSWSYGLLSDLQQATFRRLAVFRGGFTLADAEQVCADDALGTWAVVDAMGALVDKSLVERVAGPAGVRLRLLESLRLFAQQQLERAHETDTVATRHLAACVIHWRRAARDALVQPGLEWMEQQLPEIDNLRSALAWAQQRQQHASLCELAGASALLWCRSGRGAEGRRWCEAVRAAGGLGGSGGSGGSGSGPASSAPRDAGHDIGVATLALYANAWPAADAAAAAQRAADALEPVDPLRAYYALFLAFNLRLRLLHTFDHEALLQRMQNLEQADWTDLTRRFLRNARGYDRRLAGDTERYLAYCRDEVRLCARSGAVAEGWTAAQGLMLAEHDSGAVDVALAAGRVALAAIRAAGYIRQHGSFLALWVTMHVEQSAGKTGRHLVLDAWPVLRGSGQSWMLHVALAWIMLGDDRAADAARLLGWQQQAVRSGLAVAAGGTIARSTSALAERLTQQLGRAGYERWLQAGHALDEAGVQRLAMGDEVAA